MQARDLVAGQVELAQALAPLRIVRARAERADVERRRLERLHQREVVEFRIVRERDDRAALVEIHRLHRVVGHRAHERHAGHVPGFRVFLARIADRHLVVEPDRDLRQVLGQLRRADHEHPVAWAVNRPQHLAVEGEAVTRPCRMKRREAGCEVQLARDQMTGFDLAQQRTHAGFARERLEHQLQRAAARKAEAARLVGGDTVRHHFAFRCTLAFAPRAIDDVVLDATARDGADDVPILAHREHCALGAR